MQKNYLDSSNSFTGSASSQSSAEWTLQLNDFPCRVSSSQPSEAKTSETQFAEANAVVYAENGIDIQRGDEIRVGATVYEVLGIRDPSHSGAHREVISKRVDYGRS